MFRFSPRKLYNNKVPGSCVTETRFPSFLSIPADGRWRNLETMTELNVLTCSTLLTMLGNELWTNTCQEYSFCVHVLLSIRMRVRNVVIKSFDQMHVALPTKQTIFFRLMLCYFVSEFSNLLYSKIYDSAQKIDVTRTCTNVHVRTYMLHK